MKHNQYKLIHHAIEFVDVRAALLEALEEEPSEARDHRIAQLTHRKNQLLDAVTAMHSLVNEESPTTG